MMKIKTEHTSIPLWLKEISADNKASEQGNLSRRVDNVSRTLINDLKQFNESWRETIKETDRKLDKIIDEKGWNRDDVEDFSIPAYKIRRNKR